MDNSYHLQKALDYVEMNLKQKLYLDEIAEMANFSAWHFHRVFLAQTGLTIGDYIRRRRMSEACRELAYTVKSIKQIAAEYQFESQAAFSRSFKNCCGSTPGSIRKKIAPIPLFGAITIHKTKAKKGENMIKHKLLHKPAFTLIGMSIQTTMKNNRISMLWTEFTKYCDKIPNNKTPGVAIGVCMSDPGVEMTEDTPFTYLAGVEVSSTESIPENMIAKEVPAAEYAIFEHVGALDTLGNTYGSIYGECLPASGYIQDGDYDMEVYDHRFNFGAADSIMEIWIPVRKK